MSFMRFLFSVLGFSYGLFISEDTGRGCILCVSLLKRGKMAAFASREGEIFSCIVKNGSAMNRQTDAFTKGKIEPFLSSYV